MENGLIKVVIILFIISSVVFVFISCEKNEKIDYYTKITDDGNTIIMQSLDSVILLTEFHKNGTIKKVAYMDKNGVQIGGYHEYYENGILKEKSSYINGLKNGE